MTENNILTYDDDEIVEDTDVQDPNTRPDNAYDEDDIKYSITTFGKDIDIDGYVKRLKNSSIRTPDYQRKYVWNTARASLLIESLYIGLPVPQFFFYEEPEGGWSIIDGLQRLTTLSRYYDDQFALKAPGLSEELRGKKYKALSPAQKRRLDDASIRAVILRQDTPERDNSSVYELFHRINTQSSPLSAQEIRSCISRGSFNDLLIALNQNTSWRSIFGVEHTRLKDRELILRFFALHKTLNSYKPPMTKYLNTYMSSQKDSTPQDIEDLSKLFIQTIEKIWDSLGASAFRPKAENKTLILTNYDALMHGVALSLEQGIELSKENLKIYSRNILSNKKYIYGVEEFTNDQDRVDARLKGAEEELEKFK